MNISFFLSYCTHFPSQSKDVLFCGLVPGNVILIPRFSYKFLLWIWRCALNIEGYHLGIGKTYFLSTFLREERKMHTSFISQFNSTIRLSFIFFSSSTTFTLFILDRWFPMGCKEESPASSLLNCMLQEIAKFWLIFTVYP